MNLIQKLNNIYVQEVKAKLKQSALTVGAVISIKYMISKTKNRKLGFTGLCIALKQRGIHTSLKLRNIIEDVGVEYTFLLNSPLVLDIQVLKTKSVKRNKLYFLRNRSPKESKFSE